MIYDSAVYNIDKTSSAAKGKKMRPETELISDLYLESRRGERIVK